MTKTGAKAPCSWPPRSRDTSALQRTMELSRCSGEPVGLLPLGHIHPHLPILLTEAVPIHSRGPLPVGNALEVGGVGGEVPLHHGSVRRGTVHQKR